MEVRKRRRKSAPYRTGEGLFSWASDTRTRDIWTKPRAHIPWLNKRTIVHLSACMCISAGDGQEVCSAHQAVDGAHHTRHDGALHAPCASRCRRHGRRFGELPEPNVRTVAYPPSLGCGPGRKRVESLGYGAAQFGTKLGKSLRSVKRGRGGIGRREGLKTPCPVRTYRFDSGRPHHKEMPPGCLEISPERMRGFASRRPRRRRNAGSRAGAIQPVISREQRALRQHSESGITGEAHQPFHVIDRADARHGLA